MTKTHLSFYLEKMRSGETIIICKRNIPIAQLTPYPPEPAGERPVGLAKGDFEVPDDFFESLPEDILDEFNG